MSVNPESKYVVAADLMGSAGKAEERGTFCEFLLSNRGRRLRHVHKSTFINLGGPWGCQQEAGAIAAQAAMSEPKEFRPRHSSSEPSNDRGAKGVAERRSCK
jgi:hypothetical protein